MTGDPTSRVIHQTPVALRRHMGTWFMVTCLICTGQFMSADIESGLKRFHAHYERSCPGPPSKGDV